MEFSDIKSVKKVILMIDKRLIIKLTLQEILFS